MVQDSVLGGMSSGIRGPEFAALPPQLKELSFSYIATHPDGLARWLEILAHSQQPDAPAQPLHAEVTFAKLGTLYLPTLLIAASNDLLAVPFIMRMQAEHLTQAEFILVPEAGHAVNWEQPEVFNQHVLSFIRRH